MKNKSFIGLLILLFLLVSGCAFYVGTLKSVDNVKKEDQSKEKSKFNSWTNFIGKIIYDVTPWSDDPNRAKYFVEDLNNDGWPEVAVSSYDGHQSSIPSFSIVSVRADKSMEEIAKTTDLLTNYEYIKIGQKNADDKDIGSQVSEEAPDFIGAADITGDGIKEIFVDRKIDGDKNIYPLIVDFENHNLKWLGYQYSGENFYVGDAITKKGDKFIGLPSFDIYEGDRYIIFDIDGDKNKELLMIKKEETNLSEKYLIKNVFKWNGNALVTRPDLLKGFETPFSFWNIDKVLKGFLVYSSCDGWKNYASSAIITCVLRDYKTK